MEPKPATRFDKVRDWDAGNGHPLLTAIKFGVTGGVCFFGDWCSSVLHLLDPVGVVTFVSILGVVVCVLMGPVACVLRAKSFYFLWGFVPSVFIAIFGIVVVAIGQISVERTPSSIDIEPNEVGGFIAALFGFTAAVCATVSVPKYIALTVRARRETALFIEESRNRSAGRGAWPPAPRP